MQMKEIKNLKNKTITFKLCIYLFILQVLTCAATASEVEKEYTVNLGPETYNTPVYGDFLGRGSLQGAYISENGSIQYFDLQSGSSIGSAEVDLPACSSLQIVETNEQNYLLLGSSVAQEEGKQHLLYPGDLTLFKDLSSSSAITFPPLITQYKKNQVLYCAERFGRISSRDLTTGKNNWSASIDDLLTSPLVALSKDELVIGSQNGKLIFIRTDTGIISKTRKVSSNPIVKAPLIITQEKTPHLYVEDEEGTAVIIDLQDKSQVFRKYVGENIVDRPSFLDIDQDGTVEILHLSEDSSFMLFNKDKTFIETTFQKQAQNYGFISPESFFIISEDGALKEYSFEIELLSEINLGIKRTSTAPIIWNGKADDQERCFMGFTDNKKGKLTVVSTDTTLPLWNGQWGNTANGGILSGTDYKRSAAVGAIVAGRKQLLQAKIEKAENPAAFLKTYSQLDSFDSFYLKSIAMKEFDKYKYLIYVSIVIILLLILCICLWKLDRIKFILNGKKIKSLIEKKDLENCRSLIHQLFNNPKLTPEDHSIYMNHYASIHMQLTPDKESMNILIPRLAEIDPIYQENLKQRFIDHLLSAQLMETDFIDFLKLAYREDPTNHKLSFYLGRLSAANHNYPEAQEYFISTLKLHPAHEDEATQHLVWALYYNKEFDLKYKDFYENAYASSPDEFRFIWAEFIIHNSLFDEERLPDLEKIAELKSENIYLVALAKCYLRCNRLKDAFELSSILYQGNADNPEVIQILCSCYVSFEKITVDAMKLYEKAWKLGRDDEKFIATFAKCYYENNVFNKVSLPVFELVAQQTEDGLWILESLAQIYQNENDFDKLQPILEKLYKYHTLDKHMLSLLAGLYARQKMRDEKAVQVYEHCVNQGLDVPEVIDMLAEIYINSKATDKFALEVYSRYIDNHPDNTLINEFLCEQLFHYEMYKEVIKYSKNYLQFKPDNPKIKKILAFAEMKLNEVDEAITHYQAFLKENPEDQDSVKFLAEAYAIKGRFDEESVYMYFKAYKFGSRNPHLIRMISFFHLKNNSVDDAIVVMEHLKKANYIHSLVIEDIDAYFEEQGIHPKLLLIQTELYVTSKMIGKALDKIEILVSEFPDQITASTRILEEILRVEPYNIQALKLSLMLNKYQKKNEKVLHIFETLSDLGEELGKGFLEEVDEVFDELIKIDPMNNTLHLKKAKLSFLIEEYDQALKFLDKARRDKTLANEIAMLKIKIYKAMDEFDLALDILKGMPVNADVKENIYNISVLLEKKEFMKQAFDGFRYLYSLDENYKDVYDRMGRIKKHLTHAFTDGTEEKTMIAAQINPVEERYEMIEEIGRGNMGIVYRSHDKVLDEVVALKILPPNLASNQEIIDRFKAEAKAARRLTHKNIIRIYDFGEEQGYKFISMEIIEGLTLKQMVKKDGPIPQKDLIQYMIEIADALDYAHSLGIVHRDIKPANIMVTNEHTAKVADFGIAKIADGEELTSFGAVVGTPLYMSPEQARGLNIDNRSDLYSLGIVLYELLAGNPPFKGKNVISKHVNEAPAPIPDIPESLEAITLKLLSKDPNQRYQTANDLKMELMRIQV